MLLGYLLLGHLLGDFTFQTDKIAENKTKHWKWTLYHSIIVTFCMLIFALPFGSLIIGLVLLNGVLHFAIDYYKYKLPNRSPLYAFIYFVADQSLHLLIIFLISSFYKGGLYSLPINRGLMDFLIIIILISSFAAIVIQYILRIIFVSHNEAFFIGNEKSAGIITRILIFLVLYSSIYFSSLLLLTIIVVFISKVVYYYRNWHSLMTSAYFYTGLLMDFLIPVSAFYYIIKQ